ncbi:hypothetical protein EH220_01985, partial [bacterium]
MPEITQDRKNLASNLTERMTPAGCRAHLTAVVIAILCLGTWFARAEEPASSLNALTQSNTEPMSYSAPLSPLNVRVGLLENYDRLTFMMHGRYRIETVNGDELRPSGASHLRWRTLIESSTPAQILYSVL